MAADDVIDLGPGAGRLGGELVALKPIQLPDVPGVRYLVVIDKVAHTPERSPRRAGMPSKHPLS